MGVSVMWQHAGREAKVYIDCSAHACRTDNAAGGCDIIARWLWHAMQPGMLSQVGKCRTAQGQATDTSSPNQPVLLL